MTEPTEALAEEERAELRAAVDSDFDEIGQDHHDTRHLFAATERILAAHVRRRVDEALSEVVARAERVLLSGETALRLTVTEGPTVSRLRAYHIVERIVRDLREEGRA